MAPKKSPRKGSLQFWPRKRARKALPSANWDVLENTKPLKGFIAYKVGMKSALVKDATPSSMTNGKKIIVPVTILACPPIKILSARFYKHGIVQSEILASHLDRELKKKIKLPKKEMSLESIKEDSFDDVRIIAYSQVKKTGIKKSPDIVEIGLSGSPSEKLSFVKEHFGKEIPITQVLAQGQLIDIRGLTKGKGLVGPVTRFGITLKAHKSEKGVRRPGSLGPWHPARTTFHAPMAGQLGMFSRVVYNAKVIAVKDSQSPLMNIKQYGNVTTEYLVVQGSVQGPAKRQLLVCAPLRETRKQKKRELEFIELR